jgi:protein required for attachment to host cells
MADRKRSQDGRRETRDYIDDELPTPGQQGRSAGDLERAVGTRDEHKRALSPRAGATRVRKADEAGAGGLGGHHGTGGGVARREARGPHDRDLPATLAHGTWVLVADGEKALFLRNAADAETPHLVVVSKEAQDNPKDSAQGTSAPGRRGDTGPGQRSALADTDWHRLAKDRFAADLAERLHALAHRRAFDRIVLVADPRLLGALRGALHAEVRARVVGELGADLTGAPVDAIERRVAEALAPARPPAGGGA